MFDLLTLMLGTFRKDFFQVATSQGYYPKWQLPKCAISQAATFQVCPNRSARPSLQLPSLTFGKLTLGKFHIWKVATWEIVNWEVCPWEYVFGKVPNTIKLTDDRSKTH